MSPRGFGTLSYVQAEGAAKRDSRIAVKNRRVLPDSRLPVRKHLVLVGPSSTGKTTLLRALDLILGGSLAQPAGERSDRLGTPGVRTTDVHSLARSVTYVPVCDSANVA